MSIHYSCDGCGKSGDDFLPLGAVVTLHYCGTCKGTADRYLSERDAIRTNLVREFNSAKAVLVARYSVNNFHLPDEPAT